MRLRESLIAKQVHSVLDSLGGEAVGLPLAVERKLRAIGDPELTWRMETAETGFFRALAGKRRDVLLIEHSRLHEHTVLISSRAHGRALHVAWMVLITARLASDLRRTAHSESKAATRFEIGAADVFDVMDLEAFIGITKLALKQAIRELSDRDADEADDLEDALEAER